MNSLQEAVNRRRAEDSAAGNLSHTMKSQPSSLVVVTADGERCVLPWLHFVYGWHDEDAQGERLRLVFASHEVVVRGQRLDVIADEAANLRLERLRAVPEKYRRSVTASEPVVTGVEVKTLGNDAGAPRAGESS